MTRRGWIITLIAVGVGAAIVLGIIGRGKGGQESQAQAQQAFCSSLSALESSISSLQGLNPQTASTSDYQSAVNTVKSDWNTVKSDAQTLHNINMSELDSAWDSFTSAVDNVPSDASVSSALQSISQSATTLATDVKSTYDGMSCSSSSSSSASGG